MIIRSCFICAILVVGPAQAAFAQHAELDAVELRSSGEAYIKEIRFRRISRDVLYFDPTQPPPPFETRQSVQPEEQAEFGAPRGGTVTSLGRTTALLFASMVLLGIVYLFIVFGGRLPVSFARAPEDGIDQGHRQKHLATSGGQVPLGIDAVLRMKDRRLALVALCKGLLARVVTAEGVLLQDSWTDRDTLRRVPHGLAHREALQALVYASEKVQFGGRDVSEDEFEDHVNRLKPLWAVHPT